MDQNIKIDKSISNKGALDFSWLLHKPAGKYGFVKAVDGHLYFENGIRAKFIGFNFPTRACMPDRTAADKISEKLATLGVNVVRLHAADAPLGGRTRSWSSNPDFPLIDYASGNGRTLNEKGLDRFYYFASKLIEKGIYLHIDLLVARAFTDGDGLDYPNSPKRHIKSITHLNQRLIELQKEYAKNLLTHINPYTGRALIDEPAVMTIQIVNEDSIFFDLQMNRRDNMDSIKPYRDEMQKRFNQYLSAKYATRDNLKAAWTCKDGIALFDDEDPQKGTVRCMEIGNLAQPANDPMGDYTSETSPARYADFTEFCIMLNKKYYSEMVDHVRSLGAKVPIATSNLFAGAADVYSSSGGDISENNAYFNHPAHSESPYRVVPDLREYILTDPRRESYCGIDTPKSNLIVSAVSSHVDGKPYILTEWNEYGLYPFHSSAFIMTAAYACLNDWDGLINYCYHTSDRHDDQPDDFITDIMDAYNDPSLICQFGTMASIFMQGLIAPAKNKIDIVYTQNDLLTLPKDHRLTESIFPFISRYRMCFTDQDNIYKGDADIAVSGGFLSSGNYDNAKKAIIYAHSPYRDAWRHNSGKGYLARYKSDESKQIADSIHLSDRYLVFDDIRGVLHGTDYRKYADYASDAMKSWGLLSDTQGIYEKDNIVSDTGELIFNPADGFFKADAERFACFTGIPKGEIALGGRIRVISKNERITLSALPLDDKAIDESRHILFTAIGKSGLDEGHIEYDKDIGYKVYLEGKLYLDSLEGSLIIKGASSAVLWVLDTYGNRTMSVKSSAIGQEVKFAFDGLYNTANYELIIEK